MTCTPIKKITIGDGIDGVAVAGDSCEDALKAFEHLRRIVPVDIPIANVELAAGRPARAHLLREGKRRA